MFLFLSGSEVFVVCVLHESSAVIGHRRPPLAVGQVIGNGNGGGVSASHLQLLAQVFPRVGRDVIPVKCQVFILEELCEIDKSKGLGKRVVPRLRELAAPRPEGVGMRDSRNLFCPALYDISRK